MIVPMKQAALLVSIRAQKDALKKLRKFGVLHLRHVQPPQSDDLDALVKRLSQAERALSVLEEAVPSVESPPSRDSSHEAETAVRQLLERVTEKVSLGDRLDEKRDIRRWFTTWGAVSLASVEVLEAAGVKMRCYQTDRGALKKLPEGGDLHILGEEKGAVFAVLFTEDPEQELDLKEDIMPRVEVSALDAEIASLEKKIMTLETEISRFADRKQAIRSHIAALKKEKEFHAALAGMGASEGFVYLRGFLPEDKTDALKSLARSEGWGVILSSPEDPAEVPTLLRNPKVPRIIEPLFRFMGTLPGYHEVDVSFVFLLFFSLFYAMIIGDAGYGLIFLAATAFLRSRFRDAPAEPFALFYVLSVATLIWGGLTGTWFGSRTLAEWPPLRRLVIEPMFSFGVSGETTLFMIRFSFILGLIHLLVAHFMAFLKKLPSIRAVAELGWMLICAGMFFVVDLLVLSRPFPKAAGMLLVLGLAVVGLFKNFNKHPLKMITGFFGSIAGSIQNVIGAFSDIVSYIRLFAVGLASVTVAATFNDMAGGVFAPIVLVLGHGLNIVLCLMSVMVHGVRLNMLEFSGHLGQEWTGNPYEPFRE
ncbi:MAG TPA: hypothetical protein ENN17_08870 [bacterium]|nr:hypothetical protein [bacterium]